MQTHFQGCKMKGEMNGVPIVRKRRLDELLTGTSTRSSHQEDAPGRLSCGVIIPFVDLWQLSSQMLQLTNTLKEVSTAMGPPASP